MAVELTVPAVGESINEVFIGTWLKKEGDSVEKDEALVEVETDKATLEIPASVAGTLSKILKKEGDSADIGEVIAHISEGGAAETETKQDETKQAGTEVEPKAEAKKEVATSAIDTEEAEVESAVEAQQEGEGFVMPAAQRLLDENGLSADSVKGSGPGGRILKEDVQKVLESKPEQAEAKAETKQTEAEQPQAKQPQTKQPEPKRDAPAPQGGDREEETVPMSPLRRTIARRLVEAQQTAALLTTFNEIDMSTMMALRSEYKDLFEKRYDIRLGFMSFFIKATIDALKQFPAINAEIRDNDIVYKNYYDVAIAVSSKKGLVTPVIRNAERMSFAEIEATIADFGARAQNNKLSPDELTGGTFTISNGGVFGSLMSTPIVNPPQSGVLGMHAIQERPIALNGEVVIRPMMYVALTYDHRIVDGREAVTFLKRIKEAIETPARMLLEV